MGYSTKDLVLGDDLFLYLFQDNKVLAFAQSCSLEVAGETIDVSNKMSCRWVANLAGKNSYTVSADALYTQATGVCSFDTLMTKMMAGGEIDWAIGKAIEEDDCTTATFALDTDKTYYSGKAIITSLSLSAGNNEVASSSISLTGVGAIAINN